MPEQQPRIRIQRAYAAPAPGDGYRVLVDRLWPRGVSKEALRLDEWLKEAAPSTALRKRFGHDPSQWEAFKASYFAELREKPEVLATLAARARRGGVTLVFAAKDEMRNNAVALKEFLERHGEP